MPLDFEVHEAKMHRDVDDGTGDVIWLKIPPAAEFTKVKGHVLPMDAGFSPSAPVDPLGQITRVKLRKELWPAPDRDGRFHAAKLGPGIYMIAGDPDDGSSHWLFDIQKASD